MQRINRASWRIIETILLRYPQRRREYEEYIADVMSSTAGDGERLRDSTRVKDRAQSITEDKALKMTSIYFERIKRETEGVKFVYDSLKPEEQSVIKARYWTRGIRKPVPYQNMVSCSYSTRQMQRIVQKVIVKIGRYIGEIT